MIYRCKFITTVVRLDFRLIQRSSSFGSTVQGQSSTACIGRHNSRAYRREAQFGCGVITSTEGNRLNFPLPHALFTGKLDLADVHLQTCTSQMCTHGGVYLVDVYELHAYQLHAYEGASL